MNEVYQTPTVPAMTLVLSGNLDTSLFRVLLIGDALKILYDGDNILLAQSVFEKAKKQYEPE